MAEFSITDLFARAFGYNAPEQEFELPASGGRQLTAAKGGMYYATDLLGREFWLPVKIDGVLIPFAVVGVSSSKTIVKTPMVERQGSVKEGISIDDYSISIKGIVISDNNAFPEAAIQELQDLWVVNSALRMECVLTDLFLEKDQLVVLENIDWPPIAGVQNARAFDIRLSSDSIFDLEIID